MTRSPLWNDQNLAEPHAAVDKAARVRAMFSAIAGSYDLNNRLHSLGRDQYWRRKAVQLAQVRPGDVVLDVACGTGDLAMAFAKGPTSRVIGVDFTFNMLVQAARKLEVQDATAQVAPVSYQAGDAMRLPLSDQCVDVVSIAFGIRNVADPAEAMREFARVLRPGGRVIVLEFSLPRNRLLRAAYNFYFTRIMPRTASLVARDQSGAYRYLPRSVNTFIDRPSMERLLVQAGLDQTTINPLTFGIAVVYRGVKPVPR